MAIPQERSCLKRMVRKRLTEQESAFSGEHFKDSDEQLLAYVRQCAAELGGSVCNGNSIFNYDFVGTRLIKERFGENWDKILAMAGVPKMSPQDRPVKGCLYCREVRRWEWCLDKTREALAEQEQAFMARYNGAPDEDLLEYLRAAAKRLGYTPAAADIAGRQYISERFGSWGEAIRQAGLPKTKKKYLKPEDGRFFMDEFRRQEAIYAENLRRLVSGESSDSLVIATDKMAKKIQKDADLSERAQALASRMLPFKEKLFAAEYANASDKLLLSYLHECAQELGHMPARGEVIGGEFIERRFGSWQKALRQAEISPNIRRKIAASPGQPLIYTREVKIQKFLLEGRESVVRMLYKNPLVGRMQAGNVFHILRWNPAAANSAESQCRRLAKEMLGEAADQGAIEAESAKIKMIYNRTLDSLDLQTRRFEAEHKNIDEKELLAWVRRRAEEMHTTPEMLEVIGCEFILRSLHCTWGMLLRKLGLKKAGQVQRVYKTKLFKDEFARQLQLYEQAAAAESEVV